MEEEDELTLLDYSTPKGQLIKLLEQKIKKPEVDDSLSKILDTFLQLSNEQTTFLENGIFRMNFAEDALLLQSCGQYYGKRVDKLWDELLQFHTRLIGYDENAAKNYDSSVKEARKFEIAKLEERLNRGKRKKISLAEHEVDTPENGCYITEFEPNVGHELFDRNNPFEELKEDALPFDFNFEIFDEWHDIEFVDELEVKKQPSKLIAEYNRQTYRLKHFGIPSENEVIYDEEDSEEYNTREGRLISAHHVRHLFEYNDKCLLPDDHFTIAKLRFAYILKKKWMVQHNIDPEAPYETYKEDYEKYQKEFFENEKRKIQNMPQNNSRDLMRFYKALARKEKLAKQAQEKLRKAGVTKLPEINFQNLILEPLKDGYQGDYDPYVPPESDDDDDVIELETSNNAEGDHEIELDQIFVNLPALPIEPSTIEKGRSDSGYFEAGFEGDDESELGHKSEITVMEIDTPLESDKEQFEEENITENQFSDACLPEKSKEQIIFNSYESGTMEKRLSTKIDKDYQIDDNTINMISSNTNFSCSSEIFAPMNVSNIDTNGLPNDSYIVLQKENENNNCNFKNVIENDKNKMEDSISNFIKSGTVDENINRRILENCYFTKTDDFIMIIYNKETKIQNNGKVLENKKWKNKDTTSETNRKIKENYNEKDDSIKRKLESTNSEHSHHVQKRRKLSQKQIEKLRRSVIYPVTVLKWESFFSLNYKPEFGEGEIIRLEYESEEEENLNDLPDEEMGNHSDQESDKIKDHTNYIISDYQSDHEGSHVTDHTYCLPEILNTEIPPSQDSGIHVDNSLNIFNESQSKRDPQIMPNLSELSAAPRELEFNNVDLMAELGESKVISLEEHSGNQQRLDDDNLTYYEEEREKARKRVAEWKEHILHKLKDLEEHDFDIHKYGFNIMDTMSINESKSFSHVVSGKLTAEVVRYFISTLQLANTMNVEIFGTKQGELSNDSLCIKLLSKERYHEHFEDYQAPSEESFSEKLELVKQLKLQKKNQSKTENSNNIENIKFQPNVKRYCPKGITKQSLFTSSASSLQFENNIKRKAEKIQNQSANISPSKKIKILNYNVISPLKTEICHNKPLTSCYSTEFKFQHPSTSRYISGAEFQQPCSSRQAASQMHESKKRHRSQSRSMSPSCSPNKSPDENCIFEKDVKRKKADNFESSHQENLARCTRNNPVCEMVDYQDEKLEKVENKLSCNLQETNKSKEIMSTNILIHKNSSNNCLDDREDERETTDAGNEKLKSNKNIQVSTHENIVDNIDSDVNKMENTEEKEAIKTPSKVLTPKQLQKKLESEKKKLQKENEKKEREKQKLEEKEKNIAEKEKMKQLKHIEKLKVLEEKQKRMEQKQKEKELKVEQKKKEKQEKEKKRKEKEKIEEQKRKEKELEKLKRQQEIEEKNKEKRKEEEKKQKTAELFVNFFKKPENEDKDKDKKNEKVSSNFMPFELKSGMKLPPIRRNPFSSDDIEMFDLLVQQQKSFFSYLVDLKSGIIKPRKTLCTWPNEELDDELIVIESEKKLGETICEDGLRIKKLRAKFLLFHENKRPPYFGTWRKTSKLVSPRRPFGRDNCFNYEEDSDDDWEDEEQGESLDASDDEDEKEADIDHEEYEVDNEFFVPHGHLSDDEVDDEEKARLSPESFKQKLKLLKDEFDEDMKSKTKRLKPRSVGCLWFNKQGDNIEESIQRYLHPFIIIVKGHIEITKRNNVFISSPEKKKQKLLPEISSDYIPDFLKIIHGNINNKKVLIEQFLTYMANNGIKVEVSKASLSRFLKQSATYRRCTENGPMKNRFGWFVNDDVKNKYKVNLDSLTKVNI